MVASQVVGVQVRWRWCEPSAAIMKRVPLAAGWCAEWHIGAGRRLQRESATTKLSFWGMLCVYDP